MSEVQFRQMNEQVAALYKQGRFAEAVPVAVQVVELARRTVGEAHPDYAKSLNNLAMLYGTLGDFARAEPLFKRALAIWEQTLGKDHPDVATSLNNLAGLYGTLGDFAQAELLHQRALSMVR